MGIPQQSSDGDKMYMVHSTRAARCRVTEDVDGAETIRAWLDAIHAGKPVAAPVPSLSDQFGRYADRAEAAAATHPDVNGSGVRSRESWPIDRHPTAEEMAKASDIRYAGKVHTSTYPDFQSDDRPATGRNGSASEIPAGYSTFDEWPGV